ncbi:MAG: anthranilate phosphoribosyltransferase [Acidimicrobiia bacterium]
MTHSPSSTPPAPFPGWPSVLRTLFAHQDLPRELARACMREVLDGTATPAQIAAFAVALRMKGEAVHELAGLLDAMLDAATLVPLDPSTAVVDTCGTGGDGSHSINISTLAALTVAGAGGHVCKHGNRAASSACGSADVLEALGVAIEVSPATVARCVQQAGIGFCFAPRFHASMRHAGPTRREIGVPTAFNFLGPIANPGRVRRQVVGVSDPTMADRVIAVLGAYGAERAMVVFGHDGLDELTTTTTSTVLELRDGEVHRYELDPTTLGLARARPEDLTGGDAATNAAHARAVLAGTAGPHRDIVVLNAAAALVVAGLADTFGDGVARAAAALDDGTAAAALARLVTESNRPDPS